MSLVHRGLTAVDERRGTPISRLSIVVPCLDEAEGIVDALSALTPLRRAGHEVVLVDAGNDGTDALAQPLADRVLRAPRGRASQMNRGAAVATGDVLLFLHADARLPADADRQIADGLATSGRSWGRFDARLSGRHLLLRLVEKLMNWRSRLTGIATGDQAIFVKRELFARLGGYPEIALMEDVALSKRLKRSGPPLCLPAVVVASSRRWEQHGIIRTILLMWWLRLRYFCGADPRRLAMNYGYRPDAD